MLTKNQKEILLYIYRNGIENVKMTPKMIGQSPHLYDRVWPLEFHNYITTDKVKGFPTKYSLTEKGEEYVERYLID